MSANNQSVIETEQSYSPTSNPSYIEESAGPTYFPSMSDSLDIRATVSLVLDFPHLMLHNH